MEGRAEGGEPVGKGRLKRRERWKEKGVLSESEGAAVQADPGAGTQVLATGRPLEERDRLACDWLSPKPGWKAGGFALPDRAWRVPEPSDPESSEPCFFGAEAGPVLRRGQCTRRESA